MASMAGAPQHPSWFLNLQKNPTVGVQLGADRWRARATVVEGEEREALWKRITAEMPGFAKYQEKTSRLIPVVRLQREAD
jgi:proline iminopeptidase